MEAFFILPRKNNLSKQIRWFILFVLSGIIFINANNAYGQCPVSGIQNWSNGFAGCTSLSVSENSTLYIDQNVTLENLSISGGGNFTLRVKSGFTLRVTGALSASNGVNYYVEDYAYIIVGSLMSSGVDTFGGTGGIGGTNFMVSVPSCAAGGCPALGFTTCLSGAFCSNVCSSLSVGGSVSGSKSICSGSPTGTLTLSGHSGSILRWQRSTNGGSSWTNITHTSTTYSANNVTQTTQYRAVIQNGTCTVAYSSPATVTVTLSVGGTVSGGNAICSGSSTGNLSLSGQTGTIIRWQSSINGGSNWTNITHTSATYSANNVTQTTWYRAVVKNGSCSEAFSSPAIITVNPIPVLSGVSDMSVCNGAIISTSFASNIGSASISWTNNNTAIGLSASGTGNISNLRVGNSTDNSITATVTVTATANGCSDSKSFTITLDPINTWSGSVDSRWEVAGNWCGGVPTSSHNIVIPSGLGNMPVITTVAVCRNLTIQNTASLSVGAGSLTVGGVATVNGSMNLTDASSEVTFDGNFTYNGGWSSVPFASTTFNAEAKFLKEIASNSDFTVNGSLVFPSSGKITMSNGAMVKMGQSAFYSNAGPESFVSGRMEKNIASVSKFIFPIGKDTLYRPLAIEPASTTASTFQAEYFINNPYPKTASDEAGIPVVSELEFWDLDRVTGADVKVTLYWGESSKVSENGELDVLRVAHYNTVGGFWENKGYGCSTGTWRTGSVATVGYQSNFSPYTIASSTMVHTLPAEYLNFQLQRDNLNVLLTWETSSEKNHLGFEIQRSFDGFKTFEVLGFVTAKSPSLKDHYAFIDHEIVGKDAYYRLKQVDLNGDFRFSVVKYIEEPQAEVRSTRLFPNPTTGNVMLILSESDISSELSYTILSSNGRFGINRSSIAQTDINRQLSEDISRLKNGVYTILLRNGKYLHSIKLIKI